MALVAFDFDGTLSETEMTVLLGEQSDVAEDMESITRRAMEGEIEYGESLRERVQLLAGLPTGTAAEALRSVALRPGAAELLSDLHAAGVSTAILTGGFERGVRHALRTAEVSVDAVIANNLEVADDALTGEVSGPLVDGTKDVALTALASELGVSLGEVIAVGDGANDLAMLDVAGIGIGFSPKAAIRDECDIVVNDIDELRAVLVEQELLS